jgi:hypothetical protein
LGKKENTGDIENIGNVRRGEFMLERISLR